MGIARPQRDCRRRCGAVTNTLAEHAAAATTATPRSRGPASRRCTTPACSRPPSARATAGPPLSARESVARILALGEGDPSVALHHRHDGVPARAAGRGPVLAGGPLPAGRSTSRRRARCCSTRSAPSRSSARRRAAGCRRPAYAAPPTAGWSTGHKGFATGDRRAWPTTWCGSSRTEDDDPRRARHRARRRARHPDRTHLGPPRHARQLARTT